MVLLYSVMTFVRVVKEFLFFFLVKEFSNLYFKHIMSFEKFKIQRNRR